MRDFCVRDVSTRNENLSLFSCHVSLSLDKIFFFLLAAVEKKDRPASSKRGQKDQNQKRTSFCDECKSHPRLKFLLSFSLSSYAFEAHEEDGVTLTSGLL